MLRIATSADLNADVQVPSVVLRARDLSKAFEGNVVLDQVTFDLSRGEVVLLEGENGSGKTTLLNILSGFLAPDAGVIEYLDGCAQRFSFDRGVMPGRFSPMAAARGGVGRAWQETRLFGSLTLRENVAVAVQNQDGERPWNVIDPRAWRGERKIRQVADGWLEKLGLGGRALSLANAISLGQSKRVSIARAVAGGAGILLLDEPFAGLDDTGAADLRALLTELVRARAVTLVIVEHVLNHHHLDALVTSAWRLEGGRLTTSPPDARRACVSSSPAERDWRRRLQHGRRVVTEDLPSGARLTRFSPPGPAGTVALELTDIAMGRGSHGLSWSGSGPGAGLNLVLRRGEVTVLEAPNGWGKSSLLMGVAGLLSMTRGEVVLQGRDIGSLSVDARVRAGLRFVPAQHALFPTLTDGQVLRLAGRPDRAHKPASRAVLQLSGGERQQLALAAQRPGGAAYLFDEPFAALDEAAVASTATMLQDRPDAAVLLTLPSS